MQKVTVWKLVSCDGSKKRGKEGQRGPRRWKYLEGGKQCKRRQVLLKVREGTQGESESKGER